MLSIDAFPSTGKEFSGGEEISQVCLLTINDYPHILNKTVDNFEGLRCSGTSLIEGQSIESL